MLGVGWGVCHALWEVALHPWPLVLDAGRPQCDDQGCLQTLTNPQGRRHNYSLLRTTGLENKAVGKIDIVMKRREKITQNPLIEGGSGIWNIDRGASFVQKGHIFLYHQNGGEKEAKDTRKFAFGDGMLARKDDSVSFVS